MTSSADGGPIGRPACEEPMNLDRFQPCAGRGTGRRGSTSVETIRRVHSMRIVLVILFLCFAGLAVLLRGFWD